MSGRMNPKDYAGGWKLTAIIGIVCLIFLIIAFLPGFQALIPYTVADDDAVTVGILLPLTGEDSTLGLEYKQGIDDALAEINRNGDLIRPVYLDTESSPDTALALFLANRERGISVFIGPLDSESAIKIAPYAEASETIMISPAASADELSQYKEYVYRIVPSDKTTGTGLERLSSFANPEKIMMIVGTGTYAQNTMSDFYTAWKSNHGNDELAIGQHPNVILVTENMSQTIQNAVEQQPEIIVLIADSSDQANTAINELAPYYAAKEKKPFILATETAYSPLLSINPNADGIFCLTPKVTQLEIMKDSLLGNIYGYDATMLIGEAVRKYGNTGQEINAGLKLNRYIGKSGTIAFEENGDRTPSYTVLTIENGDWVISPWSDLIMY